MKTRLITAAVTAILVSGSALAEYGQSEEQITNEIEAAIGADAPNFDQLDSDQNGVITRNEVVTLTSLTDDWQDYDKNEDGQLNRAEFLAFEKEDMQDRAKNYEKAADEAEDRIDRAN